MEPLTDYYVYRASADRLAELRREADAFRLTKVLADQHRSRFPGARRFATGLTGLSGLAQRPHPGPQARPRATPQPCGC
jgi:hypothetical protein